MERDPMNILVIGNGFDLAHGLPTKYTDFLKFVDIVEYIISNNDLSKINWEDINPQIKTLIQNNDLLLQKELWKNLLQNNSWITYFKKSLMNHKENWIDFECEVSNVIRELEADIRKNKFKIESNASEISNYILSGIVNKYLREELMGRNIQTGSTEMVTYKMIRDMLYQDLNRLTKAFEIYISEYIEKMNITKISNEIKLLNIDHVLSFNYSHTYEKLYDQSKRTRYDYIHGEAKKDSEINNMVLGIDEYLPKERRDKEIDFIAFKKYYQRIYKSTGSEYKTWLFQIQNNGYSQKATLQNRFPKQIPYDFFSIKNRLYFWGHSLDITDKDILRDLILNDNIYVTIYYCKLQNEKGEFDNGEKDLSSKIANLVKVIGQEELIRRTGGSTKTIEFKLQDL